MRELRFKRDVVSLLDVILDLIEKGAYSGFLPKGVSHVEVMTPEAIRVMFIEKVDCNLLQQIALKNGFSINVGRHGLRIEDRGHIIARVGSRSDPGGDRDIFIYLFPSSPELMSMYMRATAIRFGILDSSASRINVEKFINYNLKVIGLVEKYRKKWYQNLISGRTRLNEFR